MYIYSYVCTHIGHDASGSSTQILSIYVCIYIYTYICVCIYIYIYSCIYIYILTCIFIYGTLHWGAGRGHFQKSAN